MHVEIAPGPYRWIAPLVKAVALHLGHTEIAFDGRFFQMKSDGKAYPVDPSLKTPFA